MTKTILVTGATDGIGLATARLLAADGHRVLLHGRSETKLAAAARDIGGSVETHCADFADLDAVRALATTVCEGHDRLDVLINNAGVYKTPMTTTAEGLDVRFVVNTLAPAILTRGLLPIIPAKGRVVSLSSAAQAPVDIAAMRGGVALDHMAAYAQSKLALTIWSKAMAEEFPDGPIFVAVNPGSLLASKMVKEGFGIAGNDLTIGARILCRAALSDDFGDASGLYFDNDSGAFAAPHPAADDADHAAKVLATIQALTKDLV